MRTHMHITYTDMYKYGSKLYYALYVEVSTSVWMCA